MINNGILGGMEMVKLTERLGSYFGTDEGLLVVRAPSNEVLKLEDGDVILGIDGRTPNSVSHAMRILGSYQAGETLKIEIMRDKRKRTIEIEMPVEVRGQTAPPLAPVPAEDGDHRARRAYLKGRRTRTPPPGAMTIEWACMGYHARPCFCPTSITSCPMH